MVPALLPQARRVPPLRPGPEPVLQGQPRPLRAGRRLGRLRVERGGRSGQLRGGLFEKKREGDPALRPEVANPQFNDLSEFVSRAVRAHKDSKALCLGSVEILHMTNRQIVFERAYEDERAIVLINADENEYTAHYNANAGCGTDILNGNSFDFGAGSYMPPYSVQYIKI